MSRTCGPLCKSEGCTRLACIAGLGKWCYVCWVARTEALAAAWQEGFNACEKAASLQGSDD